MKLSEKIRGYGAGWVSKGMWERIADEIAQPETDNERMIDCLSQWKKKAQSDYMGLVSLGVKAIDIALGSD